MGDEGGIPHVGIGAWRHAPKTIKVSTGYSSVSLLDRTRSEGAQAQVESNRLTGGIAQLVERQLCKLDVAGSNPAASTSSRSAGTAATKPRRGGDGHKR